MGGKFSFNITLIGYFKSLTPSEGIILTVNVCAIKFLSGFIEMILLIESSVIQVGQLIYPQSILVETGFPSESEVLGNL